MKINFNPVLCQGGTKSGLRIPKYIGPHEFKKVGGGNIGDDDFRAVGILRNSRRVRILTEMAGEGSRCEECFAVWRSAKFEQVGR